MPHYSAHYYYKTIIKLCAQIADNPLNNCLQSQGIGHGFIYIIGRRLRLTTGYVAKQPDYRGKKRLNPITQQQTDNTARLTAYGTLKSALEKFQTANTALNKPELFRSSNVTSSTEDLKVTTEAGAAPGIYTISVTQLARAQSLSTSSVTSSKEAPGDGSGTRTIKIEQTGRKEPLEIKLAR